MRSRFWNLFRSNNLHNFSHRKKHFKFTQKFIRWSHSYWLFSRLRVCALAATRIRVEKNVANWAQGWNFFAKPFPFTGILEADNERRWKRLKRTVNYPVNPAMLPLMTLKNLQIVADVESHAHNKWRASSPICCVFRCQVAMSSCLLHPRLDAHGWTFKSTDCNGEFWCKMLQTSLDFRYLKRQLTQFSVIGGETWISGFEKD